MNPTELEHIQAQLHDQIRRTAIDSPSENSSNLILDGISDINAYCASAPKIMWILKEAYGKGTDWDIWDGYESLEQTLNSPTWQVMMYTLYGIRTGKHFNHMPRLNNKMLDMLKGIAYININKYAAESRSGSMQQAFEKWQNVLIRQIECYAPDVIIFGNTFSLFEAEDFAKESQKIGGESGKAPIYESPSGILLVDTWHPNNTKMKRAEYVDSIIDGIRHHYPVDC